MNLTMALKTALIGVSTLAVSLSINSSELPLSNAVTWQTQSKEYQFLTHAIYQQASNSIQKMSLPEDNWVVVMDVDETILDNSPYQVMLDKQGDNYTAATWATWVQREQARLVVGVADFMQRVLAKGGKLALITNRDKDLDAHTWRNLVQQGLPIKPENTCLIGRSQVDKTAVNGIDIINDKDFRRQQVEEGVAACYIPNESNVKPSGWNGSHRIVMEVGDNIEDFSGVTQEDADVHALVKQWPAKLILLPNPIYGSW